MYFRNRQLEEALLSLIQKSNGNVIDLSLSHALAMQPYYEKIERDKLKKEITNEVLKNISFEIENTVRKTLDELFKDFNN